jgi:thiamine kinase-like enzyme
MQEFERFTDPGQMQSIFQQHLPEFKHGYLLINDCQLLWSRYRAFLKPRARGKSFLCTCYQLALTDTRSQEQAEQLLYAKAWLEGRSREAFHSAAATPLVSPRFGRPLVHVPELDLIVWAFPNDPELPHLPEVIEPPRVIHHLPYQVLPAGFNSPQDITGVEVEVIHYYPEERCTTRYQLEGGASGRPQKLTLFGKTFKDKAEGQEIYRRMVHFWRQSLAEQDRGLFPQPLEYNEVIKTIWQASQPGVSLVNLINRTNYQSLMEMVAKQLASLHQSDLSSPIRKTLDDHLAEIRDKTEKLSYAFPTFKEPLQALVQDLEANAPVLTSTPERLIHGDFHIQQLLLSEGGLVFFDFDEFARGDPMQDLANFMVDLHFRNYEPGLVKLMVTALGEAYQAQADDAWSRERLNWYLRLQFITKAYRLYRQQKPDLSQAIQHLISLAQHDSCF